MKKFFRKAVASTLIVGSTVFGGMALTGCEADGTGGSTPTATDNPTNPTDPTNPTSDVIVLSRSFNAAAGTVAPMSVESTTMTFGTGPKYVYNQEFPHTVYFSASQIQPGKKYKYTGVLDASGKVQDRVAIIGGDGVTNIDLTITNAIFTSTCAKGSNTFTIDVPCSKEIVTTAGTVKMYPIAPLDTVPAVFIGSTPSSSASFTFVAPYACKKQLGPVTPSNM